MKKFISIFTVFLLMFTAISAFPVSADVGNAYKNYLSAFNYKEYTGQKVEFEEVIIEHFPDASSYPIFSRSYIVPFSDIISGSFFLCDKLIYGQFRDSDNLYYIIFSKGNTPADYQEQIFLSSSPIYLRGDNDSYIYFDSDTDILCYTLGFSYDSDNKVYRGGALYVNKNYYAYGESYSKYKSIRYDKNTTSIKTTEYTPRIDKEKYSSVTWDRIFSNCDLLDISYLPNLSERNLPLSGGKLPVLNDKIDVKFTPELDLKMDRTIPDSYLGISEDYFSLEVTNHNDFPIQFKCFAVPENSLFIDEFSKSDSLKEFASKVSILVNTDDYIPKVPDDTVWMLEKNQWIYSKETSNQEEYQSQRSYLVNKPTSVFYLKSGGTFKQVIKWSQLNINKNQPYKMLVSACQCPYDRASDIQISLSSDDYSEALKHIISESYFICYEKKFSVSNPLPFDFSENFGGVISNTGRLQVDNDYWKVNAIEKDGEIEVRNSDYSSGWRLHPDSSSSFSSLPDVDIDLNNIGIDDVKNYVKSFSSFFVVLKTAFVCFPSYIWVLICFGLTALIVIGIVKALL